MIPSKRIPSSEYKQRILQAVYGSETPLDIDNVRRKAKLANWESTKALLLELVLERKIRGFRTSKGWIFHHPSLFARDKEVPLQQLRP